jgi:hypothetical protein
MGQKHSERGHNIAHFPGAKVKKNPSGQWFEGKFVPSPFIL